MDKNCSFAGKKSIKMQLKDNSLKEVKNYFKQKLSSIYDKREINSLLKISFMELFDISSSELITKENKLLSESEIVKVVHLVKDLKENKPLAYILGIWEFYGLPFFVNENTLIPRPETEELVDRVIKENKLKSPSILDIGTGSGCIAIALKKEIPAASVGATDNSSEAIKIAEKNAKENQVDIDFCCTDIVQDIGKKTFDIIVSNPPYVSEEERSTLDKSVIDYEPHQALFAGNDPLYFYKRISQSCLPYLEEGGKLFFEINPDFVEEIKAILKESGYKNIKAYQDINEKWRIVKAEY